MDALSLATACVLCMAQPSVSPNVARWEPIIVDASAKFGIPRAWIEQVMQQESGGRTALHGVPITSSAGAMGLMQVMPRTYADMRRLYGLGADPYDPRDSIFAGAAYLRAMYERYGYPNLFAAYNAGPKRFDEFLLDRRPLPQATTAYANGIIPGSFSGGDVPVTDQNPTLLKDKKRAGRTLLFAFGGNSTTTKPASITSPTSGSLFVSLSSVTRYPVIDSNQEPP